MDKPQWTVALIAVFGLGLFAGRVWPHQVDTWLGPATIVAFLVMGSLPVGRESHGESSPQPDALSSHCSRSAGSS
jgi:hypothetical protein